LILILALVPLLTAGVCLARRIPMDFSPTSRGLPLVLIGASSTALLFVGGGYFMPVSAMPLTIYGLALAVPIAASLLLWRKGPENGSSPGDIAVLVLVSGFYGCGLVDVLNGALTREPAARLSATVAATRSDSFKANHNYFVRLSSTDPRLGDGEWRVSRDSHWHLAPGSRACVDLYPGALGAAWYRAGLCPASPTDTIPWVGPSSLWGGMMFSVPVYSSRQS
jgi:hypothetical protein